MCEGFSLSRFLWPPWSLSIPCILVYCILYTTVYATRDPCRLGVSNSLRFSENNCKSPFHARMSNCAFWGSVLSLTARLFFFSFLNALDKPLGYLFIYFRGAGSLNLRALSDCYLQYYFIACYALLIYDHLLTLGNEVGIPMFSCNSGDGGWMINR